MQAKAAPILGGVLATEGTRVLLNLLHNPPVFLWFLGFAPGLLGAPGGWLLAALVTAGFVYHGAALPSPTSPPAAAWQFVSPPISSSTHS